MRCDEPVVRLPHLLGDHLQAGGGMCGERGCSLGEIVAEYPCEAGPHLAWGGLLHRREVLLDRRTGAGTGTGTGTDCFPAAPGPRVAEDQTPSPTAARPRTACPPIPRHRE